MMFKILLLQTWYGLSDYEVEERINDSLLFSEFPLLDMGLPAPDHSTICRFRAELTRLGIMDKLLRELNKQFKKHGISRIDQGAIVDASIVDSPHAPDGSILIKVADDREDLRTEEEQAQEQAYQYELKSRKPGVDTEARWVRKGRHSHLWGMCRMQEISMRLFDTIKVIIFGCSKDEPFCPCPLEIARIRKGE